MDVSTFTSQHGGTVLVSNPAVDLYDEGIVCNSHAKVGSDFLLKSLLGTKLPIGVFTWVVVCLCVSQ